MGRYGAGIYILTRTHDNCGAVKEIGFQKGEK